MLRPAVLLHPAAVACRCDVVMPDYCCRVTDVGDGPEGWVQVSDQDAQPGWVDEDGLWWYTQGGAAAIQPAWFRLVVSVMSAADRIQALRRHGFTATVDGIGLIDARHPSGLRLVGLSPVMTGALCYWEDYRLGYASSTAWHARQRAAFQRAYQAVQAVGIAELGEPTRQGRDRDEFRHRWSAWRVGEVLLAVYQAAGDLQFGLSIQLDARRYSAGAALEPYSPFVDWMWAPPAG